MSEVKIARFVDIGACKSIFSNKSTFVLRSPEYYRRMYETPEGDKKEGRPDTADGTAEFTRWVCSCWTILKKGSEPTSDEWDIFKEGERNIVAIISTPSKVCEFLNRVLKTGEFEGLPFYPVEHREVTYDKEKVKVDHANIMSVVPFAKDKRFIKENEYRFALKYGRDPYIDSFIFCGGIDYMEKRLVNPKIDEIGKEKQNKAKLRSILSNARAGYGDFYKMREDDIVANPNIIFCI
jgi:hypothetical protein